jgi:peptide/nickel transport system ATP-binding protein
VIVHVDDLRVRFGATEVLHGVGFALAAGDRLGIIGESGSGKSVMSTAITGLLPPSAQASGSVRFHGRELVGAADRTHPRGGGIAMVAQDPLAALDPLMRLGRQLALPIARHQRLRGRRLRDAVHAALGEVALDEPERIARSFPHEVSGGQRQRVAIAMALACRPDVLIADEPTTALDVTVQAQVLSLLDDLVRHRGTTLIFVSHDLPVVATMTQRVLVLQAGHLVDDTEVDRLLDGHGSPYVQDLVRHARDLDDALAQARTS